MSFCAQKYTIRDLNTGQLFALCKERSNEHGNAEDENAPEQVTDFASGKQLSLEEFDFALGLRRKVPMQLQTLTSYTSFTVQVPFATLQ